MTTKTPIDATDDDGSLAPVSRANRDAAQIVVTDWPRRDMPAFTGGAREPRYQVLVRQSVLNKIHRHGKSVEETEVCGVLVGNVHHDAAGPWLYVEQAIEGNGATERAAQVTFTAETWAHIQLVMDRDYPDRRILGWYHTHPGFGIFLSDMDVFIQDNFFGEPWQVALVYDPKAGEEGLFLWRNGRPQPDPFLVESDEPGRIDPHHHPGPRRLLRHAREHGVGRCRRPRRPPRRHRAPPAHDPDAPRAPGPLLPRLAPGRRRLPAGSAPPGTRAPAHHAPVR